MPVAERDWLGRVDVVVEAALLSILIALTIPYLSLSPPLLLLPRKKKKKKSSINVCEYALPLYYQKKGHTTECNRRADKLVVVLFVLGCMIIYIYAWMYLQMMVEVRVPNLDCEGCASKLKKALFKLKGAMQALSFSHLVCVPHIVFVRLLLVSSDIRTTLPFSRFSVLQASHRC